MQVVHIELENAPAHCVGIVSATMCINSAAGMYFYAELLMQ